MSMYRLSAFLCVGLGFVHAQNGDFEVDSDASDVVSTIDRLRKELDETIDVSRQELAPLPQGLPDDHEIATFDHESMQMDAPKSSSQPSAMPEHEDAAAEGKAGAQSAVPLSQVEHDVSSLLPVNTDEVVHAHLQEQAHVHGVPAQAEAGAEEETLVDNLAEVQGGKGTQQEKETAGLDHIEPSRDAEPLSMSDTMHSTHPWSPPSPSSPVPAWRTQWAQNGHAVMHVLAIAVAYCAVVYCVACVPGAAGDAISVWVSGLSALQALAIEVALLAVMAGAGWWWWKR